MTQPESNQMEKPQLSSFTNAAFLATLVSRSAPETEKIAGELAASLPANCVVALIGDLGAGKTCFARGIIRAKGVPGHIPITSPTFVIVNAYDTENPVFHFDWYRISDSLELDAIGYRDFLEQGGICIVEWPQNAPDAIPKETLFVHIHGLGESRTIDFYTTLPEPALTEIRSVLTQIVSRLLDVTDINQHTPP